MNLFKAAAGLILAILLTAIQTTPLLDLDLIKPNLLLIGLLILTVGGWSFWELLPALAAGGVFFWVPGYWPAEALLIAAVIAGASIFNKFFKGQPVLNFLILIILATLSFQFYFLNFETFLKELSLNVGLGLLLYWPASLIYENKKS